MHKRMLTSESVSSGHPDKIADQISDALLDSYLKINQHSRSAIEVLVTTNCVVLAGEIYGIDISRDETEIIVRDRISKIGFTDGTFDAENVEIINKIHRQSEDIVQGIIKERGYGAGDQGTVFGYACRDTQDLMPAPIYYCNKLLRALENKRISGILSDLRPDAKCQMTVSYTEDGDMEAEHILISSQHHPDAQHLDEILSNHIHDVMPHEIITHNTQIVVNPSGRFVIGGPHGDCGVTGRKIIVDTYGGACPHGGGAFSGKDPTKIDRSAAYMARYIAKNIVAQGFANECTVQISYAIGIQEPTAMYIDCHTSDHELNNALRKWITEFIDLSPIGIINHLELQRPIYLPTSVYGHFGRSALQNPSFAWERLDMLEINA